MDVEIETTNEIAVTLKVIGGKWKPLILHYLQNEGPKRYSEILHFLEVTPKKVLTTQLRELEIDGIIKRTVITIKPIQVQYAITEHGKTLFPILNAMCDWGYRNKDRRYILTHPTCNN